MPRLSNLTPGKAGPGRPKDSKDKAYLTIGFWFNELKKDWGKLRPAQRAKLSVQLMQMLTNKIKSLPSDPQDSLMNANDAFNQLKALEAGVKEPISLTQPKAVVGPVVVQPPVVDKKLV